jgi:hypothetical protein
MYIFNFTRGAQTVLVFEARRRGDRHARAAASRALSQGLDYVFFAARQQLSFTRRAA